MWVWDTKTSQWFALYYLNKVDRIIKENYNIKYYCRYMDDLIIIHQSKSLLNKLFNELEYYVNDKLKLRFLVKRKSIELKR